MNRIRAVAFDLFNTLIAVPPHTLTDANARLFESLCSNGFTLERHSFDRAHREAALQCIEESRRDGRETHNSLWISKALKDQGVALSPDDGRIAHAVEAYFSAFLEHARLLPFTKEMLAALRPCFRLGLLSNFTHGPAARKLLSILGLEPFFQVVVISGELGYRKPHPIPFLELVEGLGVPSREVIYVGDDPEPDILGAGRAGLQPVWTTYVRDLEIPFAPGIASSTRGHAEADVPIISNWNDLFLLLGVDANSSKTKTPMRHVKADQRS